MSDETQIALVRTGLTYAIHLLKAAQGDMGRRLKTDLNREYWIYWTMKMDEIINTTEELIP